MSLYTSVIYLHLPGPQIIAKHATEERKEKSNKRVDSTNMLPNPHCVPGVWEIAVNRKEQKPLSSEAPRSKQ